jgi:Transmembrane amino acid transporter protein
MIHFLKGNIGTGIFSMPSAFKNSGLWVGTGLLPIFAIICTHCKFSCLKYIFFSLLLIVHFIFIGMQMLVGNAERRSL